MTSMPQGQPDPAEVLRMLSAHRRMTGSVSPEAFAKVYLPHYFTLPPSRMHRELFAMLRESVANRSQRLAIAAPRGHAKSTVVTLAHLLWCVLYRHERMVYIVSATREQAVQLLKHVKDEIQGNERLLMDFPEVCQAPGSKTPKPWRDNNISLRNGVMVRALGSGQSLRGMRQKQHRPGLIIVDDLENKEDCFSAEQRQKTRDWFYSTLLKAGDAATNVVVIGTILHYDSLLANLTSQTPAMSRTGGPTLSVGWESRVYKALEQSSSNPGLWETWEQISIGEEEFEGRTGPKAAEVFFAANSAAMLEGSRVLWPEKEGYLQLMQMRLSEGRASFQSEKQNEPLDPETCVFAEERFKYWDDEFKDVPALLARIGSAARFYGACDPSMGKRAGRGDYSAIVTLVKDVNTDAIYVIDADIRRRTPTELIERILALAETYKYRSFKFEANQFQEVLADQLKARVREKNLFFDPQPVTHSGNKQARIESIEPAISSGKVRLCRRHGMLLDQLRQFPLGAHDDGPDALEMAVSEAVKRVVVGKTTNY